jgi:hypothetical protein
LEGDCLGFGLAFCVCFCFSRVSSGISHFLSFFQVFGGFGKGFGAHGKEFDGSGKSGLWGESVRVGECCRLKVVVSRGFGKVWERFFPLFDSICL